MSEPWPELDADTRAFAASLRAFVAREITPQVARWGQGAPTFGVHATFVQLAVGDRATAPLVVRWPSGVVQRVDAAPTDALFDVTEPEVLRVSARVAPADGATTLDVAVAPQLVGETTATIERTGAGDWTGPAALGADGALHRTLRAPASPGAARIVVSVGPAALAVRPRVMFAP